ncbi:hypothetical protein Gpo141_00012982 [Globisporangium polare]
MASSSSPSAATLEAIYTLPEQVRCLYSSKNCPHHRAVKDNGDLHKLCDLHRKKANINQQRMQERRKLMRQKMLDAKQQYLDSVASSSGSGSLDDVSEAEMKLRGLLEPCRDPCAGDFSPEDLQFLEFMLFDSDEMDLSGDDAAYLQPIDVNM